MSPDTADYTPASDDDVQMTTDDVWAFLADRGAGVLSLSGDPPYSLPMSFAVDGSSGRFVFQFLSAPDSAKEDRTADGMGASLVAYEWTTPDDWASAVVTGELVAVERTPERAAAFAGQATSVGLSVFDTPAGDLEGTWYELRPESVTGRSGTDWEAPNTFGETG